MHFHYSSTSDFVGLIMLHRAGWVHGDLSPGNLLLCNDHIKITDLEYAIPLYEDDVYERVVRSVYTLTRTLADNMYHPGNALLHGCRSSLSALLIQAISKRYTK